MYVCMYLTAVYLLTDLDIKMCYYLMREDGGWTFSFLRGREEVIY